MGTTRSQDSTTASGVDEEFNIVEETAPILEGSKPGKDGNKANRFLSRRERHDDKEGDSHIDFLYENQRGSFFFGTPLFSSRSLLNFDPSAWVDARGKPSSVDVTDAQLPDPSWEWAWNTWYVDMSQDVDEQGWEYSFMFQRGFSWHGTHPWFFSFVRRRRWVRKRVRRFQHMANGLIEGGQAMQDADPLNEASITVHQPSTSAPLISVADLSTGDATSIDLHGIAATADNGWQDIDDIPALRRRLKVADVDRKKIDLVIQYMRRANRGLSHLADEVPYIMSVLLFQQSRWQLLAAMLSEADAMVHSQGLHQERGERKLSHDSQKSNDLQRAVRAAEGEIRRLEYWSDWRDAGVSRENSQFHRPD